MFLPGFGIEVMLASHSELGRVLSYSGFWESLREIDDYSLNVW